MRYAHMEVTTQEVPGELSLCISVTGCPLRCKGCHSEYLWDADHGQELTMEMLDYWLLRYKDLATCVLFMGGEWNPETLVPMLIRSKNQGYRTCLYTGQTTVRNVIREQLDWLKTGPWIPSRGGLYEPNTNQKFIEVKTNNCLNELFAKKHKP